MSRKEPTHHIIHAGYYMTLARMIMFKLYAPELLVTFDQPAVGAEFYENGTQVSATHHLEHSVRHCHEGIPAIIDGDDNMLFMKFGESMAILNDVMSQLRKHDVGMTRLSDYELLALAWRIADAHNMLRRLIRQAGFREVNPAIDWIDIGATMGR